LFRLYSGSKSKGDLEDAKKSLEQLIEGLGIAEAEGSVKIVLIYPKKWEVVFFDINGPPRQEECGGGSCLCICDHDFMARYSGCNDLSESVCGAVDKRITITNEIKIYPTDVEIKYFNGRYIITAK
jgi:hypothetical protein